jgi:solute carrier family 35 protein F1/2
MTLYVLHSQYSREHFTGVATALLGLVLVILSDGVSRDQHLDAAEPQSPEVKVWGDALCIFAAGIYAMSNVGQEILIKQKCPGGTPATNKVACVWYSALGNFDVFVTLPLLRLCLALQEERFHVRVEFLSQMGVWGALISGTQLFLLERDEMCSMYDSWTGPSADTRNAVLAYIGAYNCVMLLLYVGTSFFLLEFDAAAFNLSLLSSDFLSVAAGVWLFGAELSWLYCAGFIAILAGVYLYNTAAGTGTEDGGGGGFEKPYGTRPHEVTPLLGS